MEACWRHQGSLEVGGLAIFWKHDIDLSVDTYSPNHIDTIINQGNEDEWRFTGFYGELEMKHHHVSWTALRRLNSRYSMPWVYAGDFNEITCVHEKWGGRPRPKRQKQEFRDILDECGLQDLGFVGSSFTWYRGHLKGYSV